MIRGYIAALLLTFAPFVRADDPLQLKIRPQLPPSVRTVAEAAAYYLAPAGYDFHARTPRTGDMRKVAFGAVRYIPDDAAPVTIETALLAIVPPNVHLYVDHATRAVAFGVAP